MKKEHIGFVGTGLMGTGMVRNLIEAGFSVTVYDIDSEKTIPLIEEGGKGIDDPALMAEQVDVIILSLPNSHVVNDVVKNALKLFEIRSNKTKELLLLDTTTADPLLSEALALELDEMGIAMLDVTISGTAKMCAMRDPE